MSLILDSQGLRGHLLDQQEGLTIVDHLITAPWTTFTTLFDCDWSVAAPLGQV